MVKPYNQMSLTTPWRTPQRNFTIQWTWKTTTKYLLFIWLLITMELVVWLLTKCLSPQRIQYLMKVADWWKLGSEEGSTTLLSTLIWRGSWITSSIMGVGTAIRWLRMRSSSTILRNWEDWTPLSTVSPPWKSLSLLFVEMQNTLLKNELRNIEKNEANQKRGYSNNLANPDLKPP